MPLSVVIAVSSCQNGDGATIAADRRAGPAALEPESVWLGSRAVPLAPATAPVIAQVETESLPPAVATATPAARPVATQWQVNEGESVAGTLRRWALAAGYTPLPDFTAKEEWTFIVTQAFTGDFEAALAWLSEGFQRQPVRPVVVLYDNHTLDLVGQATQMAGDQAGGAQ